MRFKNGLKAQKHLAQGIALGIMAISKAPCKGKSFVYCPVFKAFALTGRQVGVRNNPGRCPGLGASALSGRVELACCPLPFPSAGDRWFRAGGAYKRNLNEIIKDKTIYE